MGGAYFCKYVVVVSDDVDPTNLGDVILAMATRSRSAQLIDIMRETWSTYLDPSQNPPEIRPWGSKCIINACKEFKYIKVFSPRNLLKKEIYEQVCARWQELGFEGALLPGFMGVAVHDGWVPYKDYPYTHALCNAHHLRGLKFLAETTGQSGPQQMIELLCAGKTEADQGRQARCPLSTKRLRYYRTRYAAILAGASGSTTQQRASKAGADGSNNRLR